MHNFIRNKMLNREKSVKEIESQAKLKRLSSILNIPVTYHSTKEFKENLIRGAEVLTAEKKRMEVKNWKLSQDEIQNW